MRDSFDDLIGSPGELGAAARASIEPELTPAPLELPQDTQQRVQRTQIYKAKNLAAAGLPTYADANGLTQPVTDPTGAPLTNYDRRNSVAYDSAGAPQRVSYDAAGAPVLSDPLADAPVVSKKDADGRYSLYRAPRGLPWEWQQPDEQKNSVLDEKEARAATRAAAAALGGQLTRDHADIVRGQALIKANKKRLLADVPLDPSLLGEDPKAVEGDPKAVHAAIDEHFNGEYAQPQANEKAHWFGSDLSPAATALRTQLDQSKARAHQRADELFAHQETVNRTTQVREQRQVVEDRLRATQLQDAARRAGLTIPGLEDQTPVPPEVSSLDESPSNPARPPASADTTATQSVSPSIPVAASQAESPQVPGLDDVQSPASTPSTAPPAPPQPESALASALRPLVSHGVPALATAAGGLVSGTLAAPTGPVGAIAADVAGGSAAGYLAEKIQTKLMGPEWKAQQEAQLAANRDPNNPNAHPTAAAIGEFIPAVLSMLGGSASGIKQVGKTLTNSVGRWLGHTVEATAANPAYLARALGALPESMTLGARMGAGAAAQGLADGHGDLGDVLEQAGKGAVTMGPVVFGPSAGTLLGNVLGKAPSDAAILAFSNALYEKAVHHIDINPSAIFEEGETNLPGFMILNGLSALTHGSPFFRAARPPESGPTPESSPTKPPTSPTGGASSPSSPPPEPAAPSTATPVTNEAPPSGAEPPSLESEIPTPTNTTEKTPVSSEPFEERIKQWDDQRLDDQLRKTGLFVNELAVDNDPDAQKFQDYLDKMRAEKARRVGTTNETPSPAETAPPNAPEAAQPVEPAGEKAAGEVPAGMTNLGDVFAQAEAEKPLVPGLETPPTEPADGEDINIMPPAGGQIPVPQPAGEHIVSTGVKGDSGIRVGTKWNTPHAGIGAQHGYASDPPENTRGFIAQDANGKQRFVGRAEAGDIARKAGQTDAEGPIQSDDLRPAKPLVPGLEDQPKVEAKEAAPIASEERRAADEAQPLRPLVPGLEAEIAKPKSKPAKQPPEPPKPPKKAPPAPAEAKQRVQLKSGPQTYTVEEALPAQKGDQPDERYFRVRNERTGAEQTIEEKDISRRVGESKQPTAPAKAVEPPKAAVEEALAQLRAELEKAPAVEQLSKRQQNNLGGMSASRPIMEARLRDAAKEIGTVTVDIPGDGKFTILRTKEAITEAVERLKKLSAQPKFGAPSTGGGVGRTEPEMQADEMVARMGRAEAIKELQRQQEQVTSVAAKAMFQKTIEAAQKVAESKPKSPVDVEYDASLEEFRKASRKFSDAKREFRAKEITKEQFEAAMKEFKAAEATSDAAEKKFIDARNAEPLASLRPKESDGQVPHEEVKSFIDSLRPYAPEVDVTVLRNEKELPESVRDKLTEGNRHEGIYDPATKKIYIFSDHVESAQRAGEVFAHEAIGHHGIDKVVGLKDWAGLTDSILSNPKAQAEVRRIAQEYHGLDPLDLTDAQRQNVAREYIARLAEKPSLNLDLWKTILLAVKKALRRMGIRRNWSLDELHDLVQQSARALREEPHHSERQQRARDGTFSGPPHDLHPSIWSDVRDKVADEWAAGGHEWNARKTKADIAGGHDAVTNIAKMHGEQIGNRMKLALPEMRDREAMPFIIEAGGDATKLQQFKAEIAASSDASLVKKFTPVIDHAIANFARLEPVRATHDAAMADSLAELKSYGVDIGEVENYVTRKLEAPDAIRDLLPNPLFAMGSGGGSSPRYFTKERAFATLSEAIKAGYKPKSTDVADLDQHRVEAGKRIVEQKKFLNEVKRTPAPQDGKPIIGELEERNTLAHQQRVLDWNANGQKGPAPKPELGTPRGYTIVQIGGAPLPVHNQFAGLFRDLYGRSAVRDLTIGRAALKLAATAKSGTLVFDTFHVGRMLFKMATGGGGLPLTMRNGRPAFNIHEGRSALEYADADLANAVKSGVMTQKEADYAKTNRPKIERLMRHGLNLGSVADNLMEQAHLHIPLISGLNEWIFQKLSRGAMAQTSLSALEKNLKRPEFAKDEPGAYRQTSREMNEYFGNMQSQSILKSKTLQDVSRLIFLAPNWGESQFRYEGRAYGQLAKGVAGVARGQGVNFGNAARAFTSGAVALLAANQVINYLSRGHSTFENPEKDHFFDAWIPGGRRGFWFSPMEIAGEYSHAAMKYLSQREHPVDIASHIASNKLSPLARGIKEAATGRDYSGRHFLSDADRFRSATTAALPFPLPLGAILERDPRQPLGYRAARTPAAGQKQLMQSVGMKLTAAQSPRSTMFMLAQPFRSDRGTNDVSGDYFELRRALDSGNDDAARSEIAWLRKRGHNMDAISHAVGILKSGEIAPETFTGSKEREGEMLKSLSKEDKALYQQAQKDHRENALRFKRLLPSIHRVTNPARTLAGLPY